MSDEYFMKLALDEARKAYKLDEVPIGAVIVKNDEVIGKGYNCKESSCLATRHAEIIAIEDACGKLKNWRLDECILYVTLEPCMMCMGAILESRISKVVYGLSRETKQMFDNSKIVIVKDVYREESHSLLKKFFEEKRK